MVEQFDKVPLMTFAFNKYDDLDFHCDQACP